MPQRLAKIWRSLTEPHPNIKSLEKRYYAKLLAVAMVVFVPLGMLITVLLPGSTMADRRTYVVGFSLFLVAYLLLRLGHYDLAAGLTLLTGFGTIFGTVLSDGSYYDFRFLVLPLVLGAAILPFWLSGVFLGLNFIALYAVSVVYNISIDDDIGWGIFVLILIGGLMAMWITWSRDILERQRRETLEASEARYKEAFRRAETEVSDRKRAEAKLSEALDERGVLLKEIHHRVKNNLQTVRSLLFLQSRQFDDPIIIAALEESQTRVMAMALVHELLYQSEDLKHIEFNHYLGKLLQSLRQTYNPKASMHSTVDEVLLNIDTLIPCGLIINEIITNSMKYAFPDGRAGNIWIKVAGGDAGRITLTIADDGVGIPSEIDPTQTQSLGLQLVNSLTQQLGGTVQFERDAGTKVTVNFQTNPATGATIVR